MPPPSLSARRRGFCRPNVGPVPNALRSARVVPDRMVATNAASGGIGTDVLPFLRIPSWVTMVAVGGPDRRRTPVDRSLRLRPDAPSPALTQGSAVRRERDPRHDDRGREVRRGEPGARNARLPRSGRAQGGRLPRDRGRHQPVRDHLGVEKPPPGPRRTRRLAPGLVRGPRDRDHRHLRQHRGDARRALVADQSRRRGRPVAAVLRELLARLRPGRRGPAVRPAPASGVDVRSRRAGGHLQRPHQGDHSLQPEQSDRYRLQPRRPRERSPRSAASGTSSRSPTRSTSISSTTACPTWRWPAWRGCASAR